MNIDREQVDLLLTHGQIITMDRERRILRDGAIAIRAGRIAAVGPVQEMAPAVRASRERDLQGALVHPGFVDAHVHVIYHLTRGLVPDHYPRNRIWEEIELPLIAEITPEEEHLSALLACMEMAMNGTTTFADAGSAFNVDPAAEAVKKVGLRGIVGEHLEDVPRGIPRLYRPTDQCLDRIRTLLERYPRDLDARVWCAVSLAGMGRASDELLRQAKVLADENHVPLTMHQSHDDQEIVDSIQRYGRRPVEHLADIGILGPSLTLVRMILVDESEIDLVAESGGCVIHCPSASIKHGKGVSHIGHVPEMLQAGIPVALGSDSPNWSNSFDVGHLAYLVATIHREARRQVPTISAETALEMATLYGTQALGLADEVGSLEIGKRADIVIHSLEKPEAHPGLDPVADLVYAMRSKTVQTVLVDGHAIVEDGRLTTLDAHDTYAQVDGAARELARRIGVNLQPRWHGA